MGISIGAGTVALILAIAGGIGIFLLKKRFSKATMEEQARLVN